MSLLSIQSVYRSFGGLQALTDVSLSVEKGKITALIGPNGAGKTTLFNLISGIDKPNKGRILFNNERIDGMQAYEITAKGIARTFQLVRLFRDMSVLENVMVGRHVRTRSGIIQALGRFPSTRIEELATRDQAMSALRFVNLADRANHPAGILPHGQQRLVELARALVSDAKLLLLDEPCGGLNPGEISILQQMLQTIKNMGVTIFLIEHKMRIVMTISDKIHVLNYGRQIAEGLPEDIKKEPAVIEAYLGRGTIDAES